MQRLRRSIENASETGGIRLHWAPLLFGTDIEFFGFLLGLDQNAFCCGKIVAPDALDGIGDGIEKRGIHLLIIRHTCHLCAYNI